MFKYNPEILDSNLFKDYPTKISVHIDKAYDENDLNIDHIFPEVLIKIGYKRSTFRYKTLLPTELN